MNRKEDYTKTPICGTYLMMERQLIYTLPYHNQTITRRLTITNSNEKTFCCIENIYHKYKTQPLFLKLSSFHFIPLQTEKILILQIKIDTM
jgi:hypothetical protein